MTASVSNKRGFYIEGPRLVRLYEPHQVVTFDHGNITVEHKPGTGASFVGDSAPTAEANDAIEAMG